MQRGTRNEKHLLILRRVSPESMLEKHGFASLFFVVVTTSER